MAAGDALDSQPDALEHAVALYGLEGVFGACGGIDAMASQEGRDDPLVPPDGTKTPPLQGWKTLCADTAQLCAESLEQGGERLCDLRRIAGTRLGRGEENDLEPFAGEVALTCRLTKNPLAPVATDGVPKPFSCDEGDLSAVAFVICEHRYAHEPMVGPLPTSEDLLKFPSGFDGLHTFLRR